MNIKRLAAFSSSLALSLTSTHPLQAFLTVTGLAGVIALIAHRYNELLAK